MKRLIFAIFLFQVIVAVDGHATTIICKDLRSDVSDWIQRRMPVADFVILGKVVNERFVHPPLEEKDFSSRAESLDDLKDILERMRESNEAHHPYQDVTFLVLKKWKGPESETLVARQKVWPGMMGSLLGGGKTYLVFGYKQEDGTYAFSTTCGETKSEENATDRIEALETGFGLPD
jgi:hypothetical protein